MGGAGSGKTYSLIETIKEVFKRYPESKIACITYTNAATDEINERFSHENLIVSTIHSFLWDTIKQYGIPLKKSLLDLINDENSKIKNPNENKEKYYNEFIGGIDYQDFSNIDKGVISHDELLEISEYMYKNYKLLCDIFKDKFDFVFIDEYQDTQESVVEIFLNHLNQSQKDCIIGFFGDAMQSIYDNGVGDIDNYENFKKVEKNQNRRNPLKVIKLANKLRDDGLKQENSENSNAPNMKNDELIEGTINFLYSYDDNFDMLELKKTKYFEDWDFEIKNESKELYLTHRLISKNAMYSKLLEIYDKDNIVKLIRKVKKKAKDEGIDVNENETLADLIKKFELNELEKFDEIEIERYNIIKDELFDIIKSIKSKKEMLEKIEDMDEVLRLVYKAIILLYYYENKDYINLMDNINKYIQIDSVIKKKEVKNILEKFIGTGNQKIEDIFNDFLKIFEQENILNSTINKYYFERIRNIKFSEVKNLFYHNEEYSPYSTQHNVKGTQYKNVLIILDNGRWNMYNFKYLFSNNGTESVLKRTKKLFYVCCTRAMENLVVFYPKVSQEVIDTAKEWFGENNVHEI